MSVRFQDTKSENESHPACFCARIQKAYIQNELLWVSFFIECVAQKLEIHRSQQAFPIQYGFLHVIFISEMMI
jgi:hypothetical protein